MSQLIGDNKDVFYLAEFFLELSLFEVDFYRFSPLVKASSAIYISRLFHNDGVIKKTNIWTDYLAKFTGLAFKDLKDCLKLMLELLEKSYCEKSECRNLFGKYSQPEKNSIFLKWKNKFVIFNYT